MNKEKVLSERFKKFVVKQSLVKEIEVTYFAELEEDLGITGDDAIEFIEAFEKEFKVNTSDFNFHRYIKPEGDPILPAIIRFFTGKEAPKYLPLTLGFLEEAIKKGKLK